MKFFLLLFLLALGSYTDCQALIGIGYSYKNVLFWRFWEMKDGHLVPELLVYNTGDTTITFAVRKTYVEGGCKPSKTTKEQYEKRDAEIGAETVVVATVIPAHQYSIFIAPKMQDGKGYNAAFVNGIYAGIAGGMQQPDASITNKYLYQYYSYEGQYATSCYGLICTNNLFTKRGESGSITLLFDFTDQQKWQFFTGISDIEAKIGEGIDDASIALAGISNRISNTQRTRKFSVNMRKDQTYRLDVSFTLAQNENFPDFEMQYYFQNGSAGIRLPVFAP